MALLWKKRHTEAEITVKLGPAVERVPDRGYSVLIMHGGVVQETRPILGVIYDKEN